VVGSQLGEEAISLVQIIQARYKVGPTRIKNKLDL
jgi:hypothetical protein